MRERPELLRTIREAAAHLRAWRKIGLSVDSGAFETWEAEMREALGGTIGESHTVSAQVLSLIDGVKRRTKLGMSDDAALNALAPEIEELTAEALSIAEENPPSVRTLGDVGLMVEAQRLYNPDFGAPLAREAFDEHREAADPRKVFVVHGRNKKLAKDVFSFLRALGLHPLEWEEAIAGTGKASPYVGEVLDYAFSAAAAIIVLLSPDDEVRLSPDLLSKEDGPDEKEVRWQARPNVLFEAGMAMGRNPRRTLLIEVGQTKRFSDVGGRHTIRLADDAAKRNAVAGRLRTAGCAVSTSGEDWLTAGSFEIAPNSTGFAEVHSVVTETVEKIVDLNYPKDSPALKALADVGYEIRWCFVPDVARKVDIEGWSVAQIREAGSLFTFRLKDGPYDQILIMRRSGDKLSLFAKEILREGTLDDRRTILAFPTGRGLLIQANGKRWAAENARDEAEKAEVLRSLEQMGLIEKYRENSYQVTNKGFQVAGESPA